MVRIALDTFWSEATALRFPKASELRLCRDVASSRYLRRRANRVLCTSNATHASSELVFPLIAALLSLLS
ncbi:hypothetical protein EVAR_14517_1 [Eumeta japonica]|uniref:Uncharacterized protein n=1 Tax=Eumeta variegata TaxID=151549 RepID=A0A4C1U3B5_EUMVA|nr:hypothetical protein EVAR_14517_1 [Eumeta japonica]